MIIFNTRKDLHMHGENQLKVYPNPGAVFLHTNAEFCLRSAENVMHERRLKGLGIF